MVLQIFYNLIYRFYCTNVLNADMLANEKVKMTFIEPDSFVI